MLVFKKDGKRSVGYIDQRDMLSCEFPSFENTQKVNKHCIFNTWKNKKNSHHHGFFEKIFFYFYNGLLDPYM